MRLGEYTPDELIAVGFDEVGIVQPLLRPSGYTLEADWAQRRAGALAGLRERGLIVETPAGGPTGAWAAGPLLAVLGGRAAARVVVEILQQQAGSLTRCLAFGLLTDPPDQIVVVTDDVTAGGACVCRCAAPSRQEYAAEVAAAIGGASPDHPDDPLLRAEMVRVDGPDAPLVQCRCAVVSRPDGPVLVMGSRLGPDSANAEEAASTASIARALASLLAGDVKAMFPLRT